MYGRQGTNRVFSKVRNTGGTSAGKGSLAVFKNPFSQAELQPVIPDGKAVTSAGQRLQNVSQIEFDTEGSVTCMLFPGLGAGTTWWNDKGTGLTGGTTAVTTHHQCYTQHGGWVGPPHTTGDATNTSPTYVRYLKQVSAGGVINAWRLVSQGLRISLVNNSDQNDGWWEAIRCTPSKDPGQYSFANSSLTLNWIPSTGTGTDETPGDARICASVSCLLQTYSGNWVDNPAYITGKLRDLHKHVFCLHPTNTDHDFCALKPDFNVASEGLKHDATRLDTEGSDGALGDGKVGYSVNKADADMTDLVNGNIDFGYDVILIRIHGRPGGEGITSQTKLMSHLISNQEVCYAEGTLLERFQRRTLKQVGFARASESMRKTIRPSGISATSLMRRRIKRRAPVRRRRMVRRARPMKRRRLTRRRRF